MVPGWIITQAQNNNMEAQQQKQSIKRFDDLFMAAVITANIYRLQINGSPALSLGIEDWRRDYCG